MQRSRGCGHKTKSFWSVSLYFFMFCYYLHFRTLSSILIRSLTHEQSKYFSSLCTSLCLLCMREKNSNEKVGFSFSGSSFKSKIPREIKKTKAFFFLLFFILWDGKLNETVFSMSMIKVMSTLFRNKKFLLDEIV